MKFPLPIVPGLVVRRGSVGPRTIETHTSVCFTPWRMRPTRHHNDNLNVYESITSMR